MGENDSPENYRTMLDNLLKTVREMLSDDVLPESEVRVFMDSQMFKELCPDLSGDYNRVRSYEERFKAKSKSSKDRSDSPQPGSSSAKKKKKEKESGDYHERGKIKEDRHGERSRKDSHSEKDRKSHSHSHHKEDVKVHKDRSEDRTKMKTDHSEKPKSFKVVQMTSSSGSDSDEKSERDHKSKKKVLKKSKKIRSNSSSSSDSDRNKKIKDAKVKIKKENGASDPKSVNQERDRNKSGDGTAPKVHPFWLGKSGPAVEVKGKLFDSAEQESTSASKAQKDKERQREKERERERQRKREREKERQRKQHQEETRRRREKERERQLKALKVKPFTYYDRFQSKTRVRESTWKPHQEPEYKKLETEFKLKPLSIVCVDLSNLKKYFHTSSQHPPPPASCTSSILLKKNNVMIIPETKGDEIEQTEKVKRDSFVPVLNQWFTTNVVKRKRTAGDDSDSDSDYERANQQKKKYNRNKAVESSSDSSSDPIHPVKESSNKDSRREKIIARKGTAEYKAEVRKRQLEEIRQKAERKIAAKGTRKLPWENNEYFDKSKKAGGTANSKKENVKNIKDKSKSKLTDRIKILKKPHAPALPFQKILASIEAANKEASKKPPVHLKIPKLSDRPISTEYTRPPKQISPGDVANEVTKLLSSTSKVEMPMMPTNHSDLADYTVRKIAWWFLKSEKEPADEVALHPELHDHEIYEDWFNPDKKKNKSDDDSSIGCVSDPDGHDKYDEEELRKKALDPDWADEFCGLQSLEARFRKQGPDPADRNQDIMKGFFKIRPGTNYEKPNFEVKCFLCEEKIFGQRQYGAHIRSEQHKNHFRNYSLTMANYDESRVPAVYKKVFTAKLVTYSVDNQNLVENEDEDDKNKYQPCKLEMVKGDSPRAVIDGEDNSPDLLVQQIPDDELSLPSISKFDLSPDNCQKEAKILLRTNNLWTKEMEDRWVKATELETRLTNEYNDKRELYINEPASHPMMGLEWNKFYCDRCAEVEAEGKNPDDFDFASEWMPYWLKRMQEIMKIEADEKLLQMKRSMGMDFESLRKILQRNNLEIKTQSIPRTSTAKLSSKSSGKPLVPTPQLEIKSAEPKVCKPSGLPATKISDPEIQIIPQNNSLNVQQTSAKLNSHTNHHHQPSTSRINTPANKPTTAVIDKHDVISISSVEPGEIDSECSTGGLGGFGLDPNKVKLTSFINEKPTSEVRKSIDELIKPQASANTFPNIPLPENRNSLGYHLLTQPPREAGEIMEVNRNEPDRRHEKSRHSEDRGDYRNRRASSPERGMSKKARKRERYRERRRHEREEDQTHNKPMNFNSGNKWRPPPGPRCSYPTWMRETNDTSRDKMKDTNRDNYYKPTEGPTHRPSFNDDWKEESWEPDDS